MTVAFRFQFSSGYVGEVTGLLGRYKDKWRAFTLYLFRIPRDTETYARLDRVRKKLPREAKLNDVLDMIISVDEEAARMLMDVAPLYDRSPYDFQTFSLAVLGVDYPETKSYA